MPSSLFLGPAFRRALRFADEAQWWSAEQSREYQLDRVSQLCRLAYEQSRFYRELFDSHGFRPEDLHSLEDLRALPTMDKTTVRDHLHDMCTVPTQSPGVDLVSTGGSSGEPLQFYIGSDRSATEYAYLVSSWGRVGYTLKQAQIVFRGQLVKEARSGLRHMYDPILRRHYYSNFHMTNVNIQRYLDHAATVGPCFLHGYPSSIDVLARCILAGNAKPPSNVRGILAGSENVYPDERKAAESAFGVRYFSWYGHSEKLVMAAECEHSTSYHVWPTYGYFELLDENDQPVTTPGQRGEIVGTGFINSVMPLIRYRTGDSAVFEGDRCEACGRAHPILTNIEGRWPQGALVARDGSSISMTAFNVHDDTFDGTLGYQFFQDKPGESTLRVVPARPLTDSDRQRILRGAAKRLQGQVSLCIEICDALEQTDRGKTLRVLARIPKEAHA